MPAPLSLPAIPKEPVFNDETEVSGSRPLLSHELDDLKQWLASLLEQHRRKSSEQIEAQFTSLKTVFADVWTLPDRSKNSEVARSKNRVSALQASLGLDHGLIRPRLSIRDDRTEGECTQQDDIRTSGARRSIAGASLSEFRKIIQGTIESIQAQEEITKKVAPWKKRRSFIEKFHERLEFCMGIFLILYLVIVFVESIFYGLEVEVALGLTSVDATWQYAGVFFETIEHIVNIIFLVELSFRICLMRCMFFRSLPNIFDAILVIMTGVQMYILDPLAVGAMGNDVMLLRVLRVGRSARVLRLVRMIQHFRELRVLLLTFTASFRALAWSMVFLGTLIMLGALFISYSLREEFYDERLDHEFRVWMFDHYGNGYRATYSFFEATLSGCWPSYFRPLITEISDWYAVFIILYISIVVFAVLRIITALFLKETLQAAANDAEKSMTDMYQQKQVYIAKLRQLFEAVDLSQDGFLNFAEFQVMLDNPDVIMWLQTLELEVHDAESLFNILDENHSDEISYDEFLKGVMRLKGAARSMDVVMITRVLESVANQTSSILLSVSELANGQRGDVLNATTANGTNTT